MPLVERTLIGADHLRSAFKLYLFGMLFGLIWLFLEIFPQKGFHRIALQDNSATYVWKKSENIRKTSLANVSRIARFQLENHHHAAELLAKLHKVSVGRLGR